MSQEPRARPVAHDPTAPRPRTPDRFGSDTCPKYRRSGLRGPAIGAYREVMVPSVRSRKLCPVCSMWIHPGPFVFVLRNEILVHLSCRTWQLRLTGKRECTE